MNGLKKRKRENKKQAPLKRARSESSESGQYDGQGEILLLETEIFESKKNYNNIPKLIKILQSSDNGSDQSIIAAISLCRVFTRLLAAGSLEKTKGAAEKEMLVVKWLRERHAEYKKALLHMLGSVESTETVLTLCMRMLKTEGQYLKRGQDYSFPIQLLKDIVHKLLKTSIQEELRKEFIENYVEEYDDIRFYTFEAIE